MSKAFAKSRKTMSTESPFSRGLYHECSSWKSWVTHEWASLKPCWLSLSSRPVVWSLTFCAGGSWGAGSNPSKETCRVFFLFFNFFFLFHRIFTLWLVPLYSHCWPFLALRDFCCNVSLVSCYLVSFERPCYPSIQVFFPSSLFKKICDGSFPSAWVNTRHLFISLYACKKAKDV